MRYGRMGGVVLAVAVVAGCAQAPAREHTMTALEAIEAASRVNGTGVNGRFVFEVKAVGTNGSDIFLNSERDYRDPRSLNVRMNPGVRDQLEARLGGKLDQVLIGRQVRVRGTAERVRIDIVSGPTPTGKQFQVGSRHYYQTHVHVKQADQVELI